MDRGLDAATPKVKDIYLASYATFPDVAERLPTFTSGSTTLDDCILPSAIDRWCSNMSAEQRQGPPQLSNILPALSSSAR
jgi:hypothetical protein